MKEIFGQIYSWFESFYGQPLSEYLWGYDCSTQGYDAELLYNQFGLIALISAIIVPPIYYYAWNPVRYQQLKYWGLLFVTAIVNSFISYEWLTDDLDNRLIGNCLLYDAQGKQVIDEMNIFMFSVVNFLFTSILFFATSTIIYKWMSKAVKHYPF